MRNFAIVTALAMSSLMVHAEDRTTPKTAGIRISTGVVAPKLVKTARIDAQMVAASGERPAIVSMVVDQTGKPTDMKIVQSSNEATDTKVLEAVSQFRYTPGTVSGQLVSVPVNLVLTIQK
jgi:TonB family protein